MNALVEKCVAFSPDLTPPTPSACTAPCSPCEKCHGSIFWFSVDKRPRCGNCAPPPGWLPGWRGEESEKTGKKIWESPFVREWIFVGSDFLWKVFDWREVVEVKKPASKTGYQKSDDVF